MTSAALIERQGHLDNNKKDPKTPTETASAEIVTATTRQKPLENDDSSDHAQPQTYKRPLLRRAYDIIAWTPPNCRWDPKKPPEFSMGLNVLFAFAGAFTVANLYYNHPILNVLAEDFGVPYVKVSIIPTLAQAGYATGLLLICPLGDLLPRRPFVLSLVFFTSTICIGLCVTKSLTVFSVIQYLSAVTTVTPQMMMPLVGDLAPPHRRAAALSIVGSGLMFGILLARLLSGIVTNYVSWRVVYWLSVGLQYLIFVLLWLFMPDYPRTNPAGGLKYFPMLWSIVQMLFKHPVLMQACLISLFTSATFTNFWTVLTFLLAGPPYYYSPVIIGLFALVGIGSMFCGPIYAKYVIDRFVPLFSVILGMGWALLGICLGTYTGTFTVAGPILQAFFGDFGMQTSQIANRSAIFAVEPTGRNRVNTAFMVFTFAGQLIGTSVGAHLYAKGGWVASGSYSVGSIGVALLVTLSRGPWEEGWVGWRGGWSMMKKSRSSADGKVEESRSHLARQITNDAIPTLPVSDVEKGPHLDERHHFHAHENMQAVNSTNAEKSLELAAAEEDENSSTKSRDEGISSLKKDTHS